MRGRRTSKDIVEEVESTLLKHDKVLDEEIIYIPTGSTMLNLCLGDDLKTGYLPRTIINLIGDSASGKSLLIWTMFAEMKRHPVFKDYRMIYNEPETAFFFNTETLFNLKEEDVEVRSSETIEGWVQDVLITAKEKKSFVYVLDSLDAISTDAEQERIGGLIKKGELKSSYGDGKAVLLSSTLRSIIKELKKTKSLLIVVSQTRDNIGVMFGDTKTRAGGKALRFYSSIELWLNVTENLKKRDKNIGVYVRARIKKNKITGKLREVYFPIYYDYGVDDTASMVDFLIEEKKCDGKSFMDVTARGRDNLIEEIEKNCKVEELKQVCFEVWNEIEDEISIKRKPKYSLD